MQKEMILVFLFRIYETFSCTGISVFCCCCFSFVDILICIIAGTSAIEMGGFCQTKCNLKQTLFLQNGAVVGIKSKTN